MLEILLIRFPPSELKMNWLHLIFIMLLHVDDDSNADGDRDDDDIDDLVH